MQRLPGSMALLCDSEREEKEKALKQYKVIEAPRAKKDVKRYVGYLIKVKRSKQAAQSVFDDYMATKKRLAEIAGTIKDPENEKLKQRRLKRINFEKHNYFFLFRIVGDTVEIAAMFHGLEDYENKLMM